MFSSPGDEADNFRTGQKVNFPVLEFIMYTHINHTMASTMPGVASLGMAQSTIEGRDTIRRNFSEFLVEQNRVDSSWPINFDALTEEQANDITLYERYAFWLTYTSESSRGANYALGTRRNYLRGIAQQLLHCFPKAGSNLSKLEKGRESSNSWMSRIVGNLTRLAIQRAANEGEMVKNRTLILKLQLFYLFFPLTDLRGCVVFVLDAVASDSFLPYVGG